MFIHICGDVIMLCDMFTSDELSLYGNRCYKSVFHYLCSDQNPVRSILVCILLIK